MVHPCLKYHRDWTLAVTHAECYLHRACSYCIGVFPVLLPHSCNGTFGPISCAPPNGVLDWPACGWCRLVFTSLSGITYRQGTFDIGIVWMLNQQSYANMAIQIKLAVMGYRLGRVLCSNCNNSQCSVAPDYSYKRWSTDGEAPRVYTARRNRLPCRN